jgi:alkanesulfonate monooxygenase SsuD/methylene tetrahydromethanopterin reductase-like flavin-dependent oxidoreductase (luciferase family)
VDRREAETAEMADAFAVYGTPDMIADQIAEVLKMGCRINMIISHLMPTPDPDGPKPDYMERFATEVIPLLKTRLPG